MKNEYPAAQSDVKNPRELKPPGEVAAHAAASSDHSESPDNPTPPKKIFVCSPYRPQSKKEEKRKAELESNIQRAKTACRILTTLGFLPLAPHPYFTTFLYDEDEWERERGIQLGLQWLEEADELWVFGKKISGGMKAEIARAEELGKPVRKMPEPNRMVEMLVKGTSTEYNKQLNAAESECNNEDE